MTARKHWLLYFLGADSGPFPTDQVRIMKGMFLLNEREDHPLHGLYKFGPYDYGPFDAAVYRDLDSLQIAGLLAYRQIGATRRDYSLTEAGKSAQFDFSLDHTNRELAPVETIKLHVTSMSFDDLLLEIYDEFPAYAVASKAQVARLRAKADREEPAELLPVHRATAESSIG